MRIHRSTPPKTHRRRGHMAQKESEMGKGDRESVSRF